MSYQRFLHIAFLFILFSLSVQSYLSPQIFSGTQQLKNNIYASTYAHLSCGNKPPLSSQQVLSASSLIDSGVEIRLVEDNNAINRASKFLANSMYTEEIPTGQKKKLTELERIDLNSRYGVTLGKRKFPAAFLILEEEQDIIGCVGIETQILYEKRRNLRKIPKNFQVDSLKSQEGLVMVLANLAIRRDKRKLGYAKKLIKSCEDMAEEFLFKEIFLMVDSENIPAQKLYEKMGYKKIFEDNAATCVVSTPLALKTQDCVNYCYKKSLGKPIKSGGNNLFSIFSSIFKQ